jgi:hypothetical protein
LPERPVAPPFGSVATGVAAITPTFASDSTGSRTLVDNTLVDNTLAAF